MLLLVLFVNSVLKCSNVSNLGAMFEKQFVNSNWALKALLNASRQYLYVPEAENMMLKYL